jgi:hypothetical protein
VKLQQASRQARTDLLPAAIAQIVKTRFTEIIYRRKNPQSAGVPVRNADRISLIVMGYRARQLHTLVIISAYSFSVFRALLAPSYNEHLFRQRNSADIGAKEGWLC